MPKTQQTYTRVKFIFLSFPFALSRCRSLTHTHTRACTDTHPHIHIISFAHARTRVQNTHTRTSAVSTLSHTKYTLQTFVLDNASTLVQRIYRGHLGRRKYKLRYDVVWAQKAEKWALVLQAGYRGMKGTFLTEGCLGLDASDEGGKDGRR